MCSEKIQNIRPRKHRPWHCSHSLLSSRSHLRGLDECTVWTSYRKTCPFLPILVANPSSRTKILFDFVGSGFGARPCFSISISYPYRNIPCETESRILGHPDGIVSETILCGVTVVVALVVFAAWQDLCGFQNERDDSGRLRQTVVRHAGAWGI